MPARVAALWPRGITDVLQTTSKEGDEGRVGRKHAGGGVALEGQQRKAAFSRTEYHTVVDDVPGQGAACLGTRLGPGQRASAGRPEA